MLVHFIVNGVVINTVEQDNLVNPWNYFAVADPDASPGWLWDGKKLSPPPVEEKAKAPTEVERLTSLLIEKGVIAEEEAEGLKRK